MPDAGIGARWLGYVSLFLLVGAVVFRLLALRTVAPSPLLSDLGVALGPLLGAAFGGRTADASALLEDEDGLDRLIDQLDRRSQGAGGAEPD